MSFSKRRRCCSVSIVWMMFNLGLAATARADKPVEAIWHKQSFDFSYTALNVTYSCPGLRFKLGSILDALGVRGSIAAGCGGGSASRQLRVRLDTQSAIEASEENLRAATEFDAKDRLLAHLRQQELPGVADVPRLMAQWRSVELHQRKWHLDAGDCELLQQVRQQIFPKLLVRVERGALGCGAGGTRIMRQLRVVALIPESAPAQPRVDVASEKERS